MVLIFYFYIYIFFLNFFLIFILSFIPVPCVRFHNIIIIIITVSFCVTVHSLTAKSVCEALLKPFTITGVPSIISYDNASNFEGNLAQTFLKNLGYSPCFPTPNYLATCSLVERMIDTAICPKVAYEQTRRWHTKQASIP